jgi:hypothetical protein
MPVRYDIAAGVPQVQGGGFDPMNAFATMQAMSYRQQQNALAQMQLEQAQREAQQDAATAGLFARPGFNPLTRQGLMEIARTNPAYFRQYITPFAGFEAETMRGKSIGQDIAQKSQLFPSALSKAEAEAGEAKGKRTETDIKTAQRLLAPAYMAREPDVFAAQYAQVYNDLPDSIRKRLGARPDIAAVEAIMSTPETIAEAKKPVVRKAGETITYGTGRPGEFSETEPTFVPSNRMAPPEPGPTNAFVNQGRMQPIAGEVNAPLSLEQQIVKRTMDRRALLGQVPPEDRSKVQSQFDLAETVQAANQGLGRLAQAGGLTVAGNPTAENWKAKARATKAGLAIGSLSDSQVAEEYNNLRTIAGIMRQRIAGAIGLTARQMDAAKEMEAFEKIVGGEPSAEGLASATRRLNTINQLLGTGEATRFESPRGRGKAGEEPKLKPLEGTIDLDQMRD